MTLDDTGKPVRLSRARPNSCCRKWSPHHRPVRWRSDAASSYGQTNTDWLVVWKCLEHFLFFHIWECHNPNWLYIYNIFQRGRSTTFPSKKYILKSWNEMHHNCSLLASKHRHYQSCDISVERILGSRIAIGNLRRSFLHAVQRVWGKRCAVCRKNIPIPPWINTKEIPKCWWISSYPIGSMYAIYGNIYHQYTPNVSIYTIHGSYGNWVSYNRDLLVGGCRRCKIGSSDFEWTNEQRWSITSGLPCFKCGKPNAISPRYPQVITIFMACVYKPSNKNPRFLVLGKSM